MRIAILIHVYVVVFMGSVDKRFPRFLRIRFSGINSTMRPGLTCRTIFPRSLDVLKHRCKSSGVPGGRVVHACMFEGEWLDHPSLASRRTGLKSGEVSEDRSAWKEAGGRELPPPLPPFLPAFVPRSL